MVVEKTSLCRSASPLQSESHGVILPRRTYDMTATKLKEAELPVQQPAGPLAAASVTAPAAGTEGPALQNEQHRRETPMARLVKQMKSQPPPKELTIAERLQIPVRPKSGTFLLCLAKHCQASAVQACSGCLSS